MFRLSWGIGHQLFSIKMNSGPSATPSAFYNSTSLSKLENQTTYKSSHVMKEELLNKVTSLRNLELFRPFLDVKSWF